MKIDAHRLRQELNKCFCEMGYIQKSDVLKVIEKLEKEEKENSVFKKHLTNSWEYVIIIIEIKKRGNKKWQDNS